MARGEIRRFIEQFGLTGLLDNEGTAYSDAGLKYLNSPMLNCSNESSRSRTASVPLIRATNRLSVGHDENSWKAMLTAPAR